MKPLVERPPSQVGHGRQQCTRSFHHPTCATLKWHRAAELLKIELSLGVFPSPAQAKAVSPAHFDESITRIEGCDGLVYAKFLGHEGHISRHMSKRWRMRRTPIAHTHIYSPKAIRWPAGCRTAYGNKTRIVDMAE